MSDLYLFFKKMNNIKQMFELIIDLTLLLAPALFSEKLEPFIS